MSRDAGGGAGLAPAAIWATATAINIVASAFIAAIDAAPEAVAWMRLVMATAAMAIVAGGIRRVGFSRGLVAMGIAVTVMNTTYYLAIPRIGQGLATTLALLGPIGIAVALTRTRRDAVAAALATAGVLAIARPWGTGADLVGVAIGLAGAAGWALWILIGNRSAPTVRAADGAVAVLAVAALLSTPLGVASGGFPFGDVAAVVTIVIAGGLGAGLGYWAEVFALARIPARAFSVLQACYPAIAVASGAIVLGERVSAPDLAGIAAVSVAAGLAVRAAPVSAGRG